MTIMQPRFDGVYAISPAKAKLMYFPMFHDRTGLKNVKIEEPAPGMLHAVDFFLDRNLLVSTLLVVNYLTFSGLCDFEVMFKHPEAI